MRARRQPRLASTCLAVLALSLVAGWSFAWRSTLFPVDWVPGFSDRHGRFLHDFSYAGYHRGERALPPEHFDPGLVLDVTAPPFSADASGQADATVAIQEAIDEAGKSGGGVVYLPAGTYRVRPQGDGDRAALYLDSSGVILRGDGPSHTFIANDETAMRSRNVIRLAPRELSAVDFSWQWDVGEPASALVEDAVELATSVMVDGLGFAPGDWVVLRADATPEFIADHQMTGVWTAEGLGGVTFYRQVTAVGPEPGRLTLDIPLRYPLLVRDGARVTRTFPHIEEVAVESLAVGMRPIAAGTMGDADWNVPGTGAWDAHDSSLIEVNHVVNGWIRQVSSYRTSDSWGPHTLSNGLRLRFARSITVAEVDLRLAQYRGEGGNGVHFSIQGADCLLTRCFAKNSRHNFSVALIVATGNVVHRSTAIDARLPVDFHMHLSPANLVDAMTLDGDEIGAVRRTAADHGHGTTQSVLWNTRGTTTGWEVDIGDKKLIRTGQFGWGYVIGTSGSDYRVENRSDSLAAPVDLVEGAGFGSTLEPASLYDAQRLLRLGAAAAREPRRPAGRAGP